MQSFHAFDKEAVKDASPEILAAQKILLYHHEIMNSKEAKHVGSFKRKVVFSNTGVVLAMLQATGIICCY